MPNFVVDFNKADYNNQILHIYKKYGLVVIENILDGKECDKYVDQILKCFEGFGTGIDKTDQKTWTQDSLPPQTRPGLFQALCANFPPVWKIRTQENIQKIFSELYSKLRNKKIR